MKPIPTGKIRENKIIPLITEYPKTIITLVVLGIDLILKERKGFGTRRLSRAYNAAGVFSDTF